MRDLLEKYTVSTGGIALVVLACLLMMSVQLGVMMMFDQTRQRSYRGEVVLWVEALRRSNPNLVVPEMTTFTKEQIVRADECKLIGNGDYGRTLLCYEQVVEDE